MAEKEGFFVDPFFAGHGVGRFMHMRPLVSSSRNNSTDIMQENMVFTIEPILTMFPFSEEDIVMWADDWTVQVRNNLSAQFEHMVLIKKSGAEVITA